MPNRLERPSQCELVIFDCDGVLVESEVLAIKVWQQLFAQIGLKISDREFVERFVGRAPAVTQAAIETHLGGPLPADLAAAHAARHDLLFETELEPVEGIHGALAAITDAGHAVCVASSSDPVHLRRKLELTGLYERFAPNLFTAAEVEHGKPAPDLFLHAARTMGVPPERCVVVEDSGPGVQAARAAGMHAFAYQTEMVPRAALEGPGTTLFDDMRELPGLIAADR